MNIELAMELLYKREDFEMLQRTSVMKVNLTPVSHDWSDYFTYGKCM